MQEEPGRRENGPLTGRLAAAIITGGSSGIGKSLILELTALRPELLVINLSRSEPTVETGNPGNPRLRHVCVDLSSDSGPKNAANRVFSILDEEGASGPILLINNSGFGDYAAFQEADIVKHLTMIDLNIKSVVALTGLILPRLLEHGGAVVNVASTAAFQPCPFMGTYGATKSFIMNWTLALWRDLRGTGVHALCLCPGPTRTNFFTAAGFSGNDDPLDKQPGVQSADAVARECLKALDQRKPLCVSGTSNRFLAFLSGKLPRAWAAHVGGWVLDKWRARKQ